MFGSLLGTSESRAVQARRYALIVAGATIVAVAMDCFLIPAQLAPGGASGLATILYYVALSHGITLPIGMQMLVMNALLVIFVLREGGLRYAARTIVGFVALSLSTDLLAPFLPNLSSGDLILSSLWGAIISGIGMGIVFRSGGNTGGTDILSQILARRTKFPIGQWMILIDGAIVVLSAVVFSVDHALYAGLSLVVTSLIVDLVIDGLQSERACWIISSKTDEIIRMIHIDLDRGCTTLPGKGEWTGEDRKVIFVLLSRKDIGTLKAGITAIDAEALVAISDVHEAFGNGFKKMGI
jgi:uncharacterized membrane-anchored protein YitT (DUF2179 family)